MEFLELLWLPPLVLVLHLAFNKQAQLWLQSKVNSGPPMSPVCVCGGEIRCTGASSIPEGVVKTYTLLFRKDQDA
jgi:hypothetical protein